MFDALLSVLAPHVCVQCGREGSLWCAACRAGAIPSVERCYRCHQLSAAGRTCQRCRRKSSLFSVRAAIRYETAAKQLVWKLKFERARAAASIMAGMMIPLLAAQTNMLVVYVPTATNHVRQRGYDQAELIARLLARRAGLPILPCLVRLGQHQQRGAQRRLRMVQLKEAFYIRNPERVRAAQVLLVDDVITTGATLEAAAAVLKQAGAKRVEALVFAQA